MQLSKSPPQTLNGHCSILDGENKGDARWDGKKGTPQKKTPPSLREMEAQSQAAEEGHQLPCPWKELGMHESRDGNIDSRGSRPCEAITVGRPPQEVLKLLG